MGQYNGKRAISFFYVSKPLIIEIIALGFAQIISLSLLMLVFKPGRHFGSVGKVAMVTL